jgi:hypothetical protein
MGRAGILKPGRGSGPSLNNEPYAALEKHTRGHAHHRCAVIRLRAALAVAAGLALVPVVAASQVRTADPAVRGVPLTEFPRVVQLAERVYGYEEIRSPGFTTVSLFVVGDSGVLLADGQGNVAATRGK